MDLLNMEVIYITAIDYRTIEINLKGKKENEIN